ncbi:AraC family transcriptional regulator [Limnobacter thiooxidans]|nr:AraC family transcriptional regulator [Limnobacter thiooxidans]
MHDLVSSNSIYLAYVDEYLRELGEDSEFVFKAAGVDNIEQLRQVPRVPTEVMAKVYERVYRNPRLGGFFIKLGERIPLTAHGNLGVAFLVSPNIRTILQMLQRFTAIAIPWVNIQLDESPHQATINIQISAGSADFKAALVESIVIHIAHHLCNLLPSGHLPCALEFQHSQPEYVEDFYHHVAGEVRFNAARNCVVYPMAVLSVPVKTADRLNQGVLEQQCAEELRLLQKQTSQAQLVRGLIVQNLSASPTIQWVARQMSTSERSLRRRLQEEGESFRNLLAQVRHEEACRHLRETDWRIERIAKQLGYSETASFSLAFREVAGVSPRQWREQSS